MAATTVTGKGLGSVDKKQKGSEHLSIGASKLIGPRVVAAGRVTLAAGTLTLVLPPAAGVAANYVCVATDETGANAVKTVLTNPATGLQVVFTGTGTDVVQYSIIKVGLAL
jgi:hypothetical protein